MKALTKCSIIKTIFLLSIISVNTQYLLAFTPQDSLWNLAKYYELKALNSSNEKSEYYDLAIKTYQQAWDNLQSKSGLDSWVEHQRIHNVDLGEGGHPPSYLLKHLSTVISWLKNINSSDIHPLVLASLYSKQGENYRHVYNLPKAIEFYKKAMDSLNETLPESCDNLSVSDCLIRGDNIPLFEAVWEMILRPLSNLYREINHYQAATDCMPSDKVVRRYKSEFSVDAIADIYLLKGKDRTFLRDSTETYETFARILGLNQEELSDEMKARTYLSLGNAARINGDFSHAEKYLKDGITQISSEGISKSIKKELYIDAHLFKGYLYRDLGIEAKDRGRSRYLDLLKASREEYKKARDSMEDLSHSDLNSFSLALGEINLLIGDIVSAADFYKKVLGEKLKDTENISLGSFTSFSSTNPAEIWALEGLSDCQYQEYLNNKDKNALQNAANIYEIIYILEDSLRSNYFQKSAHLNLNKLAEKRLQKAMNVAYHLNEEELGSRTAIQLALNVIDRSQAVEMKARLRENEIMGNSHVSDSLLLAIHLVEWELHELEEQFDSLFRDKSNSLVLREGLESKMQQKRLLLERLNAQLENEHPFYFKSKYANKFLFLDELQHSLNREESIVMYFWGEKELYTLSIGDEETELLKIEVDNQLEKGISFLREFASNVKNSKPKRIEYRKISYEVYQRLIGKSKSLRNDSSLIIVPHKKLNLFPFEILLTERTDSTKQPDFRRLPYIWKRYLIRYSYSPSLLLAEETNSSNFDRFYVGFAPSYSTNSGAESQSRSSEVTTLYYNIPEVEAMQEVLGEEYKKQGEYCLAADATEEKFRQLAFSSRIVHVSMHTENFGLTDNLSQLLFSRGNENDLSNDALLNIYEIYPMHMNADLMVLSACKTGVGTFEVGEGIISLSRAFRMTGCKNLVSSLWNANDSSAKSIIKEYFKYLHEGFGKAKALQQAKIDYLNNTDLPNNRIAPYYWAQFVHYGDNNPIVFPGKEKREYYWVVWANIYTLSYCFGGRMVYTKKKSKFGILMNDKRYFPIQ